MTRARKILIGILLVAMTVAILGTVLMRVYFPKEKVKALVLQRAQATLHREVRVNDVSVGFFRGIQLSGLEISEIPDFKSGVLLSSEHFFVRPQLLPLIWNKLIARNNSEKARPVTITIGGQIQTLVSQATIKGSLSGEGILRGTSQNGTYNIVLDGSDLDVVYGTAAFHKKPGVPLLLNARGTYASPLALQISELKLTLARLVLQGPASYTERGYEAQLKSNEFPLEDVAPLLPSLNDFKLVGPATLTLRVKSTAAAPDAQGTLVLKNDTVSTTGLAIAGVQSQIEFTARDTAGSLTATRVQHTNFTGNNLKLKWNLLNAADLAKISGGAELYLGPGEFNNIDKLMNDSKIANVFLLPMRILKDANKLAAKFGGKLPALDRLGYQTIAGSYGFQAGVMDIKKFDLSATKLEAGLKGTVKLTGTQSIRATSQLLLAQGFLADLGAMTLRADIGGTVSDPQVRVDPIDTGNQILNSLGKDPQKQIEKLLKGLFNNK